LIQYLQSVTPYVDTRDRSIGGQAKVVGAGLSAVTDAALKRWESVKARDQRFLDRVAALDDVRTTATLAQQAALSLKRDVERLAAHGAPIADASASGSAGDAPLPAPTAGSSDASAFKYVGFEDQFRGSQDEIRRRLTDYVERFSGRSDIIDIGCGRGEFLALLGEHGITARGVDLNAAMVETARERGLDVRQGDALGYLETLDDDSVGGVFGAQVAEHLEPSYLDRLVDVSRQKLRPGGLLVLETINPACWSAFFDSYLRDLTHVRALHPDTLQFVLRANGFHSVDVEFRSPVPQHARLETVPVPETTPGAIGDLLRAFNDNVEKLNARMFTHQDYAVTGRK
jgi:O-antigen chain-terminating methyltransferase